MVDVVDKETRSRMMANIRGKNTSPEFAVRRFLHAQGLRYRLHVKHLPGKPDLVFPRFGVALFVHGCFWHRHDGCRFATTPASNTAFWEKKFDANKKRDETVVRTLTKAGWRVLVIWECEINEKNLVSLCRKIRGRNRES
jgi:DNA mismatch endonuclease, patch repair protein